MISRRTCPVTPVCGATAPRTRLKPWLKLVLWFSLAWVCIFGFGYLASFLPGAERMAKVIDERNLRATAIYYTDLEESYEGSQDIRHSLEYPPGREEE